MELLNYITQLENKLTADYKKLLKDVLKEELHETGWWSGAWRSPELDANKFLNLIKVDITQIERLHNEQKLAKDHIHILDDLKYRLSLLTNAEGKLRGKDPRISAEIHNIIREMTGLIDRLIKAIGR